MLLKGKILQVATHWDAAGGLNYRQKLHDAD